MTLSALEEARAADLDPWIDSAGRLRLRGPRRSAEIARRLLDDPVACATLREVCRPLTLEAVEERRRRLGVSPEEVRWVDPARARIERFEAEEESNR